MQKSIVTYYDSQIPSHVGERTFEDAFYISIDDHDNLVLLDENEGTVALYPRGQWLSYRSEESNG